MTTKTDELKPCPFCGHRTIFTAPDEIGSGGQWVAPIHVGCNKCGAEQIGDDEESARANWNRRAALQSRDSKMLRAIDQLIHGSFLDHIPNYDNDSLREIATSLANGWAKEKLLAHADRLDHARRIEEYNHG